MTISQTPSIYSLEKGNVIHRFFACLSRDGKKQLTVYQCILPHQAPASTQSNNLCVKLGMREASGIELVDINEKYPNIFVDLDKANENSMPQRASAVLSSDPVLRADAKVSGAGILIEIPMDSIRGRSVISPIAWTQDARDDKRIVLPTGYEGFENKIAKWNHIIYIANSDVGLELVHRTVSLNAVIRWDLLDDFKFPNFTGFRFIATNARQSCHDLWIPTTDTNTDGQTAHIGLDGTEFIDKTNLRVARFHNYGFKVMPIVNGCMLTPAGHGNTAYFFGGGAKMILEEVQGKDGGPGYIKMRDDVGTEYETEYFIYPSKIKKIRDQPFLEYHEEKVQ